MRKRLVGRVKFNGDRATILGCVSKKYHKQLSDLAAKMSKEQGKTISISYLVRIALEAMFVPENEDAAKPLEDKNQLCFFPQEKEKPTKKRGTREKAPAPNGV